MAPKECLHSDLSILHGQATLHSEKQIQRLKKLRLKEGKIILTNTSSTFNSLQHSCRGFAASEVLRTCFWRIASIRILCTAHLCQGIVVDPWAPNFSTLQAPDQKNKSEMLKEADAPPLHRFTASLLHCFTAPPCSLRHL